MKALASGLSYMQERSIYYIMADIFHRDIKPANILLKDGQIKIADFGESKQGGMLFTHVGTPAYQAPEVEGR
jgi:serine/threonine-protein kinase ULK/ATG1